MRRLIILFTIMLLCFSLTLAAKTKKEKLLESNLKQWEEFRWQGIVQVESSVFSARKNFVLAKNSDALRIDILDSGVLGLQAKPLAVIYIKDKIYLEAPTIKQLAGLDPNWFFPQGAVQSLLGFTDSLQSKSLEIIAKRKTNLTAASFAFDKKLRLTSVQSSDKSMEVDITYNSRNQPSKLSVKRNGTQLAEFQINEQKYGKITIEPLQVIPDIIDLEQLSKELSLDGLKLDTLNPDSLDLPELNFDELLDSLEAQGLLKGSELNLDEIKKLLKEMQIDPAKLKELLELIKPEDLELYLD